MSNILKKITVKNVVGEVKKIYKTLQEGENKTVMRIYGYANEVQTKENNQNDSVYCLFSGDFEAVNLETGETYRSGQMILPGVAESPLHGALVNSDMASVQFAYDIGIKEDENSVTGYVYWVKSLIEDREQDPLNSLRTALPSASDQGQQFGSDQTKSQAKSK